MIVEFIKELRSSSDIIYNIFTEGSCFRLFKILKILNNRAEPYWSDRDNHCITKIDNIFYDIGGVVNSKYIEDKGYYLIPESQINGFELLKYTTEGPRGAEVEKYRNNESNSI